MNDAVWVDFRGATEGGPHRDPVVQKRQMSGWQRDYHPDILEFRGQPGKCPLTP